MTYRNIVKGLFIKRLNRFIAEVDIEGETHKVHVKNTGRCKELFIEGTTVFLEESDNPNRKTKYSLVGIYKGDLLINIDSQVPNRVVYDALLEGKIKEIGDVVYAKREVKYGASRFDIYYETSEAKGFIEVKGVTLEEDGLALFPDAPTERGARHVRELTEGLEEGYKNYAFFLVQMDGVERFRPNHERDMIFAQCLYDAYEKGVGVLVYNSIVTETGILMNKRGKMLKRFF